MKKTPANTWRGAVTAYNRISLVKIRIPNWITTRPARHWPDVRAGRKGRAEIRANPAARSSELLKKVFAKQDK